MDLDVKSGAGSTSPDTVNILTNSPSTSRLHHYNIPQLHNKDIVKPSGISAYTNDSTDKHAHYLVRRNSLVLDRHHSHNLWAHCKFDYDSEHSCEVSKENLIDGLESENIRNADETLKTNPISLQFNYDDLERAADQPVLEMLDLEDAIVLKREFDISSSAGNVHSFNNILESTQNIPIVLLERLSNVIIEKYKRRRGHRTLRSLKYCSSSSDSVPLDTGPRNKRNVRGKRQSKSFECYHCGKIFNEKLRLICHIHLHTTYRPYACKMCNATFKTEMHMERHYVVHSDERNFQCDICKKTYKTRHYLNRHVFIHRNIKRFVCEFCGKGFKFAFHLRRHVIVHRRKRKWRKNRKKRDVITP